MKLRNVMQEIKKENKMTKLYVIVGGLIVAGLLVSCGSDFISPSDEQAVDVPTQVIYVPVTAPAPTQQQDIQSIVDSENEYRTDLGQAVLSPGLSCALSTFTSGERIQASIAGHNTLAGLVQVAVYTYTGVFNQPDSNANVGVNELPAALRSIYTNLYLLRCQGQVVIQNDDYYQFSLTSDDGSVFYLDNAKLIDSDNAHGAVTVSGQKFLRRGVHVFRLDYSQSGAGNMALVLQSAEGSAALNLVQSNVLFH